jgi:hypothetical protein
MAKLLIQGLYTVLGKILASEKICSFQVAISDKNMVYVDVIPEENAVKSREEVEVSIGLLKAMEAGKYGSLSNELESELSGLTQNVSLAARRVLSLIKYCFNQYNVDEQLMSSKGLFWSKDGTNWKRISQRLSVAVSVTGTLNLNDDSCKWLQDYIDSDYQPFLALRHLHRARKESTPRHKWIEATIAAELAIKEFLIRHKPDLSTILLEVPSPPMHKMYGVVLKEYAGEKLDKKIFKALVDGAEKRNRLLHRPQDEFTDFQAANNYVSAVSEAIRRLLSILYPKYHLVV